MVSTSNQLGITAVGKDELTPVMKRAADSIEGVGKTLKKVEGHTNALDKAFGSLGARIKTGFQLHVLNSAMNLLERSIRSVADAIPDLIRRGSEWAKTVDELGDVTGMTAKQASTLAGVVAITGSSIDGLTVGMVQLSKNAVVASDKFKAWGIQTKDANGHLLSSYDIFQNVRRRLSELGQGAKATALGTQLMGRGFKDIADIVTLTDPVWNQLVETVTRAGLVMTTAGAQAIDQWHRYKNVLDLTITGIGNQILMGVAPALTGLTNAVTQTIQNNMTSIVNAVAFMVTTVASAIASLLGYDLGSITLPDLGSAGGGGGTGGGGPTGQAKAAKKAADGMRDMAAAMKTLRDAQKALAEAKGTTIFGANMSEADRELAKQARAAAIADAQQRVSDAQKALHQHQKTMHAIAAASGMTVAQIRRQWSAGGGPVTKGLQDTITRAQQAGKDIADAIKDAIFGSPVGLLGGGIQIPGLMGGSPGMTVRTGGLVGALQGLQSMFQTLSGHLTNLNGLLGANGPLIVGIGALALKMGIPIPTGGGGGGGGAGQLIPWVGISLAFKDLRERLDARAKKALEDALAEQRSRGPRAPTTIGGMPWLFPQPQMGPYMPPSGGTTNAGQHPVTREDALQPVIRYLMDKYGTTSLDLLPGGGTFSGGKGGFFLGLGGSTDPLAALRPITDQWRGIADDVSDVGPLARGLADIVAAVNSVRVALDGSGESKGGSGLGNTLSGLRARMTAAETVNKVQATVLKQHGANIAASALVNSIQSVRLTKDERKIKAHGQLLDSHEARLDRLDGGGGDPKSRGVRSGGHMTIQLDRRGTRDFLSGRSVNTSLKPA